MLKDVSFTIHQGERLALVGLNGAGKSTIVKLISGLYLPTNGAVYVNGIDTRELDRKAYMHHVAAIFQNPFIMSYTVGENVTLSGEWDEERLWNVLEKAGVAEKISSLPDGLYTYFGKDVSEDGIMLSGGQIQKLLLARALYHSPKLSLLDEPTAALDALAEKIFMILTRRRWKEQVRSLFPTGWHRHGSAMRFFCLTKGRSLSAEPMKH